MSKFSILNWWQEFSSLCTCQIKTESIRKLSHFNFQWIKTSYRIVYSIVHSFLHFSRAIVIITCTNSYRICNNTKDNFLWEPKKMNFKFHRNWCVRFHFGPFCEIWNFNSSKKMKKAFHKINLFSITTI